MAASAAARRRKRRIVIPRRRQRVAGRLRPDLAENCLQQLDAGRERIAIGVYGWSAAGVSAAVFEDRETPGNWRVEKMDEDGGYEVVKVFTGPEARQQAIQYAEREFGTFDEIRLEPYRPAQLIVVFVPS
jgi:hypothetical protein